MSILISGVNGFIGGELFSMLAENKNSYAVTGTGRKENNTNPNYFPADLSSQESTEKLIRSLEDAGRLPDVFVHCASVLAGPNNGHDIALFRSNNLITENVIRIVKALNIKSLVNLSTIGVYPNKDGEYNEHSAIDPRENFECLYALAKFCSEQMFNFFLPAPGCTVTNLRLSQVYGGRMRNDRIFKIMEEELKRTGKITVWGMGERVSNFVAVEYVLKAIAYFIKQPTGGLFNLGGENISYNDLAKKVAEINHYPSPEICLIDKGVSSKVFINSDKLKSLLQDRQ